jgi:hypothetical protein
VDFEKQVEEDAGWLEGLLKQIWGKRRGGMRQFILPQK